MARDVDQLTLSALGWALPVSGLRDWLQGYATRPDGSRYAASPAEPTVQTRDGWQLRYVDWQETAGAHALPRRIDATRPADLNNDEIALRIVIDPPAP